MTAAGPPAPRPPEPGFKASSGQLEPLKFNLRPSSLISRGFKFTGKPGSGCQLNSESANLKPQRTLASGCERTADSDSESARGLAVLSEANGHGHCDGTRRRRGAASPAPAQSATPAPSESESVSVLPVTAGARPRYRRSDRPSSSPSASGAAIIESLLPFRAAPGASIATADSPAPGGRDAVPTRAVQTRTPREFNATAAA